MWLQLANSLNHYHAHLMTLQDSCCPEIREPTYFLYSHENLLMPIYLRDLHQSQITLGMPDPLTSTLYDLPLTCKIANQVKN